MEGQALVRRFFEYIFPRFCVACGREGENVCSACLAAIDCTGIFCCPVCHTPSAEGVSCLSCRKNSPLVRHVAIVPFTETSPIHEMIHLYKYEYLESLETSFNFLIEKFFFTHQLSGVDIVVPVPLHRKRFVERGFNQSKSFALSVSRVTGVPFLDPLQRVVHTVQQATLDRQGRIMNVSGVFSVIPTYIPLIRGKRLLVVDDVFTTGSTVFECARALHLVGVEAVSGFSIARG